VQDQLAGVVGHELADIVGYELANVVGSGGRLRRLPPCGGWLGLGLGLDLAASCITAESATTAPTRTTRARITPWKSCVLII